MTKSSTQKWIFPARFRAGAYSWKSSRLACQRLREAASEIKKVAKKEPVLAAEGGVRLIEKLWPALEHVDSSSGALGSAVNKTLYDLIPLVINAPADVNTRQKWLVSNVNYFGRLASIIWGRWAIAGGRYAARWKPPISGRKN